VLGPATHTHRDVADRLLRLLERERLTVAVVAIYAAVALVRLPRTLNQDAWLALVSGRLVAHDGLPHHDTLTVWASGSRWVDQQWLSQLLMYALHTVGGLRLVGLVHVALVVFALVVAVVLARRRAEPLTVLILAMVAIGPITYISGEVRTQAFGVALFAVVLAFLLSDARAPSRRVWVVLPLLAVWANLHGSVVLGAGLVVLRGLTIAVPALRARSRHDTIRGLGLAAGAIAATFASPYAADTLWYYSHTAFNPLFGVIITEWVPTTPGPLTAPFYLLLLLAAWTIGRRGDRMTPFEKLLLLVSGVGGMLALRYTGWFALAALMILPAALDAEMPRLREGSSRAARLGIALAPVGAFGVAVLVTATRPARSFEHGYPAGPAAVVARVAASDRRARIFSEVRFSDWLLWHHPELAGRLAFDARFELLTRDQLFDLMRWSTQVSDGWRRAAAGFDVIVLDRNRDPPASERPATYRALLEGGGFRLGYLSRATAILIRTGTAAG
jgi:hypothetical protein